MSTDVHQRLDLCGLGPTPDLAGYVSILIATHPRDIPIQCKFVCPRMVLRSGLVVMLGLESMPLDLQIWYLIVVAQYPVLSAKSELFYACLPLLLCTRCGTLENVQLIQSDTKGIALSSIVPFASCSYCMQVVLLCAWLPTSIGVLVVLSQLAPWPCCPILPKMGRGSAFL